METLHQRIESYLEKEGLLKINNTTAEDLKSENFKDFLLKIMQRLRGETTHDMDNNLQTRSNRRRSIGDLYRICKFYRPETTIEELQKTLPLLVENGIYTLICPDIYKRVWRYEGYGGTRATFFNQPIDEFGLSYDISEVIQKDAITYGGHYLKKIEL